MTKCNKQTHVSIYCVNNGKTIQVPTGSTLLEIYDKLHLKGLQSLTHAKVNNVSRSLAYTVYNNKDVEFLDITSPSGLRVYTRSLFFVLSKACKDLFPEGSLRVEAPVSNGYYCQLSLGRMLTEEDIQAITRRMQEIIDQDIPFVKVVAHTDEAIKLFSQHGYYSKVKLLQGNKSLYTKYYTLDGEPDYYYDPLLLSTGQLSLYGLMRLGDGLLLRVPDSEHPDQLKPLIKQEKMLEVFREHQRWQDIIGVSTIGELNEACRNHDKAINIINISEALQEKKISNIAEEIQRHPEVRLIMISGPSSSGKTTFSKRLSVQLMACGLKPFAFSMDDYFVDRTKTPRDANGDYDYESIYALNIPKLQQDLQDLLEGKEVELPKYDFTTGKSSPSGKHLQIDSHTLLVMEGIHGLNPKLTKDIPDVYKFKIYVSALTTILLDYHNYIPTSDNRLLRRIVRDYKYRNYSAEETIGRWQKVQAGERKWIFPYQENADVMFNSALLFELAGLRSQALPLLEMVPESSPQYSEAYRLRKFLNYIVPIRTDALPPTSLLREFLGGSTFHY
ncbi:MAG: nucleoside kinase [Prevotellaceae bacterium]|nr:nucleoside kinase [Prevotellaceae bacterium]MDY3857174.1 nucleoside kinase [Bacteroidaceae bacterium]